MNTEKNSGDRERERESFKGRCINDQSYSQRCNGESLSLSPELFNESGAEFSDWYFESDSLYLVFGKWV